MCHLFISLCDELNLKVPFVQPVRAVTTLGSGHLLVLDDVFIDYGSSRFSGNRSIPPNQKEKFTKTKMELSSAKMLNPITVFLMHYALTAFALAFISPSLITRLAIFTLNLVCMYVIYSDYLDSLPSEGVAMLVSQLTFLNFLFYLDFVVLSRWSFDGHGPAIAAKQKREIAGEKESTAVVRDAARSGPGSAFSAFYRRLRYGSFISSSTRLIGTNYQIKNVPNYVTSNPAYTPSRAAFVLRKTFIFCICYLVLDLATASAKTDENHIRYSLDKVPFFRRWGEVNREEIIRRLIEGVAFWTMTYCTLQCCLSAWETVCVIFGSDPEYWRPNFGPLSEAYTIRQFWG